MSDEDLEEIAELESATKKKPQAPKAKPCIYCGTPIIWRKVNEGTDEERSFPHEEDGSRHQCQEYFAAKRTGTIARNKARALFDALVAMYPEFLDE